MKKNWICGLAAAMSLSLSVPAWAGWIQDTNRPANQNGISNWWYRYDDGSYPTNGWVWLDGNGDGFAESYRFDGNGWMYASTTVDGYSVSDLGAWTENGSVQYKLVNRSTTNNSGSKDSSSSKQTGSKGSSSSSSSGSSSKKTKKTTETTATTKAPETTAATKAPETTATKAPETTAATKAPETTASSDCGSGSQSSGVYMYSERDRLDMDMALECFDLINEQRVANGLDELEWDYGIYYACQIRAMELAESFSHTRPNATTCFTALKEADVSYRLAGENIAAGQTTAARAMNAWMNSTGHRANILKEDFGRSAIGCYFSPGSSYRWFWVQMFTD